MVQTAIIAFILILLMFLFTDGEKKGHKDVEENIATSHVEVDVKTQEVPKHIEKDRQEAAFCEASRPSSRAYRRIDQQSMYK